MPLITDWLMFGITFVYVVATIFICIFNYRSAKATRAQVEESQNQFYESKRLECMPFLQLEIPQDTQKPLFEITLPFYKEEFSDTIYKVLWLKNLGNGTATNINYAWQHKDLNINETGYPPINAIMEGDKYCFQFTIDVDESVDSNPQKAIVFQFDDLLGNTYEQKVTLCFEDCDLVRCETDTPRFLGTVLYSIAKD
jgi:hypothetical protein